MPDTGWKNLQNRKNGKVTNGIEQKAIVKASSMLEKDVEKKIS